MKTYNELLHEFETALSQTDFQGNPAELYDPIKYMMDLGGKRVRPVLTLMACNLFQADTQQAIPAALAVEVFHNFTLVHDDIMDNAPLRRGQETVYKKWNMPVAILSGDLMMIRALQLLHQSPNNRYHLLFQRFTQTAIEVCEGQQWDMNFESMDMVSHADYIRMIELKTSVLLACSLYMGAIVGGSSEEDAELLYQFGKNIGIAFQIQDDILDAFGDERTGKQVGGDIAANKKTVLWIELMEASITDDQKLTRELMANENVASRIEGILHLYQKYQVREFAEDCMQTYLNKAFHALEQVSCSAGQKQILHDTASALMQRTK